MAGRLKTIRTMVNYYKRVKDVYLAAHIRTLLKITTDAHAKTIKNQQRQFIGRNDRKLTGNLLRSTRVGFDGDFRQTRNINRMPRGFIVVATEYAAIHEFGGVIKPKRAKNLWVRLANKGRFKRFTPSDFMEEKKKSQLRSKARARLADRGLVRTSGRASTRVSKKIQNEDYFFMPGKKTNTIIAAFAIRQRRKWKVTPLFALKKRVNMPKRPYVQPAVRDALKFYGLKYNRTLAGLVATRFLSR